MKKTLLLIAMMLCCATAILAQNNRISYQAVVRDTANRLVANKTVTVTVNIYNGDETTAAYTETHTNVQTNYNGLFSLQIGGGTATGVSWDEAEINWKDAKVITAVSLGGTQLATLEMPLTAVPYALYADEINPDGTVVTNIYNKMYSDSLALGTLIDANAAEIVNLKAADANLSQRIVADSNNLVIFKAKVKTDSTTLRNLIDANAAEIGNLKIADASLSQRIVADSNKLVALQNRVNTFNTHICDSVMACETIEHMRDSIQDNAAAIAANATAIATKANAADVEGAITQLNNLITALTARVNHLHDSIEDIMNNMPVMGQDSFTVAENEQTEFTLNYVPEADHVLRMYINGVMVGGSHSGVLTINPDNNKEVVYHPEENKNRDGVAYVLKAGDKVTVVYWYVATAITPGN